MNDEKVIRFAGCTLSSFWKFRLLSISQDREGRIVLRVKFFVVYNCIHVLFALVCLAIGVAWSRF
jgi:hypothetical protein